MSTPRPRKRYRYRCRYCGLELRAWLLHFQKPSGSLLVGHLGNSHRAEIGPYLDRMRTTDDITPVVLEAYEAVEEP